MHVGINLIGSEHWESYQIPALRTMKPSCAKFNLYYNGNDTPFFGSSHLDNVLDLGVQHVIFRTAETYIASPNVEKQLLTPLPGWQRSTLDYITTHPDRTFWIEVGNEPDLAGVSPWIQRWNLLQVAKNLIPRYRHIPNLKWIASMSTDQGGAGHSGPDYFNVMMSDQGDGAIWKLYGALGVHAYAWNSLQIGEDGNHPWAMTDWCYGYCHTPLWVTEAGINSTQPWSFKGELYRNAVQQPYLVDRNVMGVTFFTLSRNPEWCRDTNYGIDVSPDGTVDTTFAGMRALSLR